MAMLCERERERDKRETKYVIARDLLAIRSIMYCM